MNIFYTSTDPLICATALDDKRLVKMCLETAQMCSTTVRIINLMPDTPAINSLLLAPTHVNHPCNIWARSNLLNLHWLVQHGLHLCREYGARYMKVHDCVAPLYIINEQLLHKLGGVSENFESEPPNCARNSSLGIDCTSFSHDTTECYREYLRQRWATDKRAPKWTAPAKQPEWR